MSSSLFASTLTSFPSTTTQRAFKTQTNRTHGFRVSCNAAPDHDHNDNKLILPEPQKLVLPNVDRRNLLVGLGGLYTAANFTSLPEATAEPITTPDFRLSCNKEVDSGFGKAGPGCAIRSRICCPPTLKGEMEITDFQFPTVNTERKRWPAHKGTDKQINDYRRAIQLMKKLPDSDPRSFANQAKIHCAYCHGAYSQSDKAIQIHMSWVFFPFHRLYLYFYERILGDLIGDPTFALPYWNWDAPDGMQIPEIFVNNYINGESNPLYDQYHEASHLPPETVDLNWSSKKDKGLSPKRQVACNLSQVYRELVRSEGDAKSFFGGEYVAGSDPSSLCGSVESGSHTSLHMWVGDSNLKGGEDMGRFYSAGYDPLFYCHHANVDRMWKLWKGLSSENKEPDEDDWKKASYVFYDENKNLVRVYNKDSVSLENLGYSYIEESKEVFPWLKGGPAKRNQSDQVGEDKGIKTVEETTFPLSLDMIQKVRVKRPAVQTTEQEKKDMPKEFWR